MNSLYKRIYSAIMVIVAVCIFSVTAYAESYTGKAVVIVNPNTDSSSATNETVGEVLPSDNKSEECEYEIYDVHEDKYGNIITEVKPVFEELTPVETVSEYPEGFLGEYETKAVSYSLNETMNVKDTSGSLVEVICVYIGEHCVIWRATGDDSRITINKIQAKKIADYFDEHFETEINCFGDFYDEDGDGKISIICYDIGKSFASSTTTYTAGYFRPSEMINSNGYAGNTYFGKDNANIGIDCIHIDTYPGMSTNYGKYLDEIEGCYPTLIHEFQHLINFSCQIKENYRSQMETYLDEAFSMAAQHMICGSDSVSTRIDFINSSSYVLGNSLCVFNEYGPVYGTYSNSDKTDSGNDTLSKYANSYLLGQYIRVRYGRLKGNDGNTIFKDIETKRQEMAAASSSSIDTLQIVADLLGTTKNQLITDFWTSVFVNGDGTYGFKNSSYDESWSDNLYFSSSSVIKTVDSISSYTIGNGGAIFAYINSDKSSGTCELSSTVTSKFSLDSIDSIGNVESTEIPELTLQSYYSTINSYGNEYLYFTFKSSCTGTIESLHCSFEMTQSDYDDYYISQAGTTEINKNSKTLSIGIGDNDCIYFYYVPISETGERGTLHCFKFEKNIFINSAEGGGGSVYYPGFASGTDVTLTVSPDSGYILKYLNVGGKKVYGDTIQVNKNETINVTPVFSKLYLASDTDITGNTGNVFWRIQSDGALYIYGDGEITNYTSTSSAPWYAYRESITSIEVMSRINYIGTYAFADLDNVTSITIGSCVTELGENSIYKCPNLSEILFLGDIPDMIACGIVKGDSSAAITSKYLNNKSGWTDCTWKSVSDGHTKLSSVDYYKWVGDANGDGKRNIVDALVVRLSLVNGYVYTDKYMTLSDVNGDGDVDILDVHKMREFAARIITGYN